MCPGFHGRNAGTFGLSLFRRGGNSQLTLILMGPLPLSILGSEEAGSASSFSRRSCMAGGFVILGVNLERGTSSFFFIADDKNQALVMFMTKTQNAGL